MLAHEECDLVDVVTADHLHFEPVMECLEAGKHVISEKPLSLDIEKQNRWSRKQKRRGFTSRLITIADLPRDTSKLGNGLTRGQLGRRIIRYEIIARGARFNVEGRILPALRTGNARH